MRRPSGFRLKITPYALAAHSGRAPRPSPTQLPRARRVDPKGLTYKAASSNVPSLRAAAARTAAARAARTGTRQKLSADAARAAAQSRPKSSRSRSPTHPPRRTAGDADDAAAESRETKKEEKSKKQKHSSSSSPPLKPLTNRPAARLCARPPARATPARDGQTSRRGVMTGKALWQWARAFTRRGDRARPTSAHRGRCCAGCSGAEREGSLRARRASRVASFPARSSARRPSTAPDNHLLAPAAPAASPRDGAARGRARAAEEAVLPTFGRLSAPRAPLGGGANPTRGAR